MWICACLIPNKEGLSRYCFNQWWDCRWFVSRFLLVTNVYYSTRLFFFLLVITRISSVFPWLFAIVAMCSPEISPYLVFWKCGIPKIKDIKIKENYDEKVCPDFYKQHKSQLHCWTVYMPLGDPSRFRIFFFADIFILIHYNIYMWWYSTYNWGIKKRLWSPCQSWDAPQCFISGCWIVLPDPPKKHNPTFGQFTLW